MFNEVDQFSAAIICDKDVGLRAARAGNGMSVEGEFGHRWSACTGELEDLRTSVVKW